jgi:hypothetical protein
MILTALVKGVLSTEYDFDSRLFPVSGPTFLLFDNEAANHVPR